MGKLITEQIVDVQFLTEGAGKAKKFFLEGTFMQAEVKNRNGRLYPKNILEREVNRYRENYINKNRALGELGHPDCFHEATEILTLNGWKKIKDVVVGEHVFTLNSLTKEVEIHPVEKVYAEHYTGKMIEFTSRLFSTKTTSNHRFLLKERNDEMNFYTAQEIHDENFRHKAIPKTHTINFSSPETFMVSDQLEVNFDDFVAFLATYLAEGCVVKRSDRKESYVINIFQNEGWKADRIREILSIFNFSENKRKNGSLVWRSHNYDLALYLTQFGKAKDKYIDKNILQSLDKRTAKLFLETYIIGDGRGNLDKKYSRADVFSISEQMIDDLSYVAFIAEIPTRKFFEEPKDSRIGSRKILKENKNTLYFCRFLSSENVFLDDRYLTTKEVDHDDKVYCVTVKNGTFYARDNGYTFWTGNSPGINLDKVSHKIISLIPEKNDYIGKAEILNTPNGNIVKSLIESGVSLGVSTRGVGSLKPSNGYQIVCDDFYLATAADIVADPSAPDAFVQGIMENKQWVLDHGIWTEQEYDKLKNQLNEARKADFEDRALRIFANFMLKIAE